MPCWTTLAGHGVRVVVKHDNHLPVNTFKIRNAVTALLRLESEAAAAGVATASTGNHGQGVAWAGARLGIRTTVCVPVGNNPEKKRVHSCARGAPRGNRRELRRVRSGLRAPRGARRADRRALHQQRRRPEAGAGTLTEEFLQQVPELDALVLALGGGSQSTGAIVVRDAVKPAMQIFAAQSEVARAQHDAWRDGTPRSGEPGRHIVGGASPAGSTYDFTFDTLRTGLTDFVLVSEADIAQAIRDLLRITHKSLKAPALRGWPGSATSLPDWPARPWAS